ncbi:MAG TPA: hypothetical protein VHR45_02825 [Thermoanaerobaculia bacterium]|nr:hypothetical protein [Thermoanaerobaculia bacterium]
MTTAVGSIGERGHGIQATAGTRRLHDRLLRQVERLGELAAGPGEELLTHAEVVSAWSVAEHLEHLVLSDRAMLGGLDRLLAGPPPEPIPGVNIWGRLVLLSGFLPRGKGRATKPFLPSSGAIEPVRQGIEEIEHRLRALGGRLGELERAPGRFKHLLFGGLGSVQWLRVLEIHHHHHLKIIRDIRDTLGFTT